MNRHFFFSTCSFVLLVIVLLGCNEDKSTTYTTADKIPSGSCPQSVVIKGIQIDGKKVA